MVDTTALESLLHEVEQNEGVQEAMLVSRAGTYLGGSFPRGVHVDTFGSMFAVLVGSAMTITDEAKDSLESVVIHSKSNKYLIVHAGRAGVDGGYRLRDFIEKVTVPASRFTEHPFAGQCSRADVPPSKRPGVARLVCREPGLRHRGGAEPGPEPEWVGRDGDAAQCDDPFRGLRYREIPGDDLADSIPEDMAGSRRDLDCRDHEEVVACRGLRDRDPAHGIVVCDRDSCKTHLSGDTHKRRRIDAGIGRVLRVVVEVEEHERGSTVALSLKDLRTGIPRELLCGRASMSRP